MPFCPVCRCEYAEVVIKCADCGAELVREPPPLEERDNPEAELVEILRAGDEIEAQLIRGVLDANGIECVLRGESLRLTFGITADGLAEVKILVRREDADQARQVIAGAQGTTA